MSVRSGLDNLKPLVGQRIRTRATKWREVVRSNLPGERLLPDFLVIGAQRGGTSSLYRYLSWHPSVLPPLRKETEYLSRRFARGLTWYQTQFPLRILASAKAGVAGRRIVTFEATPDYLFYPGAAKRAAELLPETRLVALLRDPAERAISHHRHMVRLGFENAPFAEALEREQERIGPDLRRLESDPSYAATGLLRFSYCLRGEYASQLEEWLRFFPREGLLVVRSEDFYREPAAVYRQVIEFLELPTWEPKNFPNLSSASSRGFERPEPDIEARLREHFSPHNRLLAELLGTDPWWSNENRATNPRGRSTA